MPRNPRNYASAIPDPMYVQTWEAAAKNEVTSIPLETTGDAVRFRQLLYETRKILQAQSHELYPLIENLSISRSGTTITIGAANLRIKNALAAAGIGVTEAPDFE